MRAGQGQTLIDVAVERSGRAGEAWALAVSLGVSLTNRRVVRNYTQGQTHPATELTEGIGGWRIGQFIIG